MKINKYISINDFIYEVKADSASEKYFINVNHKLIHTYEIPDKEGEK